MTNHVTRRDFIKCATLGVAVASAGPAIAQPGSANERLDIAIIGVGGQGEYSYGQLQHENIVAIADVDEVRAGKAWADMDSTRRFKDYRVMLDKLQDEIDAVVVATPDHTHFHASYMAMGLNKHLYLEKPMAHNVWEVRKLTEVAAARGLATQLGMQRHVKDNMHRVTELIQAGAIGDVVEVHSCVSSARGMFPRLEEPQTVPSTLDYELWLGPVEFTPYDSKITPYGWRFWWDFGTGETGNWGCHILDIPFTALGLDYPTHVAADGPPPHPEMSPTSMHSWFEFPARGTRKAVTLHWYQADGGPAIYKELGLPKRENNLFIGTDGVLVAGFDRRALFKKDGKGGWQEVLNENDSMGFDVPPQTVPDSPGFHQEWVNACKGDPMPPTCNFSWTGPLTETVLLGNVAYRAQAAFDWDHTTMTCAGAPAAQALIKEGYKKGWELA